MKNEKLKDHKLRVLIQTVNNNEFFAAMLQLQGGAVKYIVNDSMCDCDSFYFVGKYGKVRVAIVQTSMGTSSFGGS